MKGLFFGLTLGLAACGHVKDVVDRHESAVSATVTVSERLQKDEDLLYRLLCSEGTGTELGEVGRLAALKGTTNVELSFSLDHALEIGSVCRLEIRGLSKGVYAQGAAYEFLAESDLYYASAKASLVKAEGAAFRLDVALYKVYRDLNVDVKPVATEVTFPAGTEGTFKLKLSCGDKNYVTTAMLAPATPLHKGTIAVPYKDLTAPLSCGAITATKEDGSLTLESVLSPALEITRKAAVTVVTELKPPAAPAASTPAP